MGRTLPANAELAEVFERLADLLELDGADAYRTQAYRRAAARIRDAALPVAELALSGKATTLQGIGKTIEAKIVELAETGDLVALAKVSARVPAGLVDVMRLPGLGPKTTRRLWQELGVEDRAALARAAAAGRVRELPGLGPKSEESILRALSTPAEPTGPAGALLGRALPFVSAVVADLTGQAAAERVSEAGSVRRRVETVRDLDVIATARDPRALIDHFLSLPWVAAVLARGPTKATALTQEALRFDLRVVPPESYGSLLQHFTGSAAHNVALREDAVRRGLSVSEYGIEESATGELVAMSTEEELYAYLDYAWIPPELREDTGELEAARAGSLPDLVEYGDVQGDLHVHTDWSDGRATLDEMVAAARGRGYRYLAICDHASRLGAEGLERQAEEIAWLARGKAGIRVLSGVEVDIRRDGSVDLADDVLSARDWVVASLHSGHRDDRGSVTKRVLAAMENPHVDCIGHLTGRKIGRRPPADLDLEAVFAKAAATGTFLELNGQPDRLDLRDAHARLAAESGVRLVVSSDAHSVAALGYLELAVSQARRAWLAAPAVANTRPWAALSAMIEE